MCGIAGLLQLEGRNTATSNALQAVQAALVHRGPDDYGVYVDDHITLLHQRLSVIDVSHLGHQPYQSEDGRYVLVFNGEIYNFKELQEKYLSGITLRSHSDTEVLLHMLIEKGAQAISLLKGMFAFAFWDMTEKELLLARDPFGKKPLYFRERNGGLEFASELRSLLSMDQGSAELDQAALTQFLAYEYVPSPATGVKGVRQVPMGHWVKINPSGIEEEAWWTPQFTPKIKMTEKKALEHFDALLGQAVERRLIADVPIGLFLSGGLDSTTIGWYMRQCSHGEIHSCSIGFEDSSFDESKYIFMAAESLGTTHHHENFTLASCKQMWEEMGDKLDVLLADPSFIPTYQVSKLAARYMKVVLDGDGSDELLGGYGTFTAARVAQQLTWVPENIWRLLQAAAYVLPVSHRYFSWDFKVKSFLRGTGQPLDIRNQVWLGAFDASELVELLTPDYRQYIAGVYQNIEELRGTTDGLDVTDMISLLYVMQYMHNDILVKLDRATMYASLEARTPFLDVDLADFLMKLPADMKHDKVLLKRLMRGRIPDPIVNRTKKGFGIPIGRWLGGPLFLWMSTVLSDENIAAAGIVRPEKVKQLMEEHQTGRRDHRKKLWTLIVLHVWYEKMLNTSA